MRTCPFTHCGKRIDDHRFACGPHWYSLTKDQRTIIWDAYRSWQTGELSGDDLRQIQQQVIAEAEGSVA